MSKFKILIYDPYKVHIHSDLLSDETQALEIDSGENGIPEFKSRSEAKEWIKDYIEIMEMPHGIGGEKLFKNDWNNNNCRDYNDLFVFN